MKSTKFLQAIKYGLISLSIISIIGLCSTTSGSQEGECADDYDEVGSIPTACSLQQGDHRA